MVSIDDKYLPSPHSKALRRSGFINIWGLKQKGWFSSSSVGDDLKDSHLHAFGLIGSRLMLVVTKDYGVWLGAEWNFPKSDIQFEDNHPLRGMKDLTNDKSFRRLVNPARLKLSSILGQAPVKI